MTFICYCLNCQHVGGGAFAYMKAFPKAEISISSGEDLVKEYEDWDNLSGNVALRYFCSHCVSRKMAPSPSLLTICREALCMVRRRQARLSFTWGA